MEEIWCDVCRVRPAMKNDLVCQDCSDRYEALLRTARIKTDEVNARSDRFQLQRLLRAHLRKQPRRTTELVGFLLLEIGLLALTVSVLLTSTILTFIGLGLTFWGMIAFFIRPQRHVRSELINATGLSSFKTIDRMMSDLGYRERGVYVPISGPDRVVVFVPSEPFSVIERSMMVEGEEFLKDLKGLMLVPPGLALTNLIERKLGFDLKGERRLEAVIGALPKVLVEDLEIARDAQIQVKIDHVDFKLVDSIYVDFCREMCESSSGVGCPVCSAFACILAIAAGGPVILLEEDKASPNVNITGSSYQLLNVPKL